MNKEKCEICLNDGRPVKFVTSRIKICQWCVSLFQEDPYNPAELESHFKEGLTDFCIKPPKKVNENVIREEARRDVRQQQSFLEALYAFFIDSRGREKKIKQEYINKLRYANAEYHNQLRKYAATYEQELTDKYRGLMCGEYMPRVLVNIPGGMAYADFFGSTDKKNLKRLRAFKLGLTSLNAREERLDREEMSALRTRVALEDGNCCSLCKKPANEVEMHLHHIIPLKAFGSNHFNNLVLLCYSCHNKQHPGFNVTRHKPVKRLRTGGEFIAVDTETTGFSPKKDRIIEIAAVRFKDGIEKDRFVSLVNPHIPLPAKITKLTGITGDMLTDAPSIEEIFPHFHQFIGEVPIVCHNAPFDMRFLESCANRMGISLDNEVIDTLPLSRKKLPHLRNHKLQTLVSYLRVDVEGKHRAYADSFATGRVYIQCLRTKNSK